MISNIEIFGKIIPLYGICFYLGIAIAAVAALVICKKISFSIWEIVYAAIYIMIGAILGAKLLFILVSWEQIIQYNLSLIEIIKGGFVFYGGLIGGVAGLLTYTHIYKEKPLPYFEIYSTVLPLGHAIGRVGCFFAGCCYGIPCDFGIIYTQTAGLTPLGVRLLPIQLIEAACLIILFIVLVIIFFKSQRNGIVTLTYCILYSLIRFILEFFRGDVERGILLGLSTSQWICIFMFSCATLFLILSKKRPTSKKTS